MDVVQRPLRGPRGRWGAAGGTLNSGVTGVFTQSAPAQGVGAENGDVKHTHDTRRWGQGKKTLTLWWSAIVAKR